MTVNFSEPVYTVGEGDGQVEVCAVLTGQTARNITVTITTQSDTASCAGRNIRFETADVWHTMSHYNIGGDFSNLVTTDVTYFQSLDQNQTHCVNITILEDVILENEEQFIVFIDSTDSNVTTGLQSTVIIIDNDG